MLITKNAAQWEAGQNTCDEDDKDHIKDDCADPLLNLDDADDAAALPTLRRLSQSLRIVGLAFVIGVTISVLASRLIARPAVQPSIKGMAGNAVAEKQSSQRADITERMIEGQAMNKDEDVSPLIQMVDSHQPRYDGPITFISFETRGELLIEKVDEVRISESSRIPFPVKNLGAGRKWDGLRWKISQYRQFFHSKVEKGEGDEIVVVMDGGDTVWGGCAKDEFVKRYKRIVEASGAEIVFGAEFACWEQFCNKMKTIPAWAQKLAGDDKDLDGGFWTPYAKKCHLPPAVKEFMYGNPPCGEVRNCGVIPPFSCGRTPSLRFLNSGFFVGPVSKVSRMFDWVGDNYEKWFIGDQAVFGVYFLNNTKDVTLDYLGELDLNLGLWGDISDSLHVDSEGKVQLRGMQGTRCMIHGNGHKDTLHQLLKNLTTKPVNLYTGDYKRDRRLFSALE